MKQPGGQRWVVTAPGRIPMDTMSRGRCRGRGEDKGVVKGVEEEAVRGLRVFAVGSLQ